mmetsp:Transcript_54328/g.150650  ORF Transcript_54328/g.150650 Transcript_54328/m.150650 type:complete len:210 (-) Transcript_54328:101-730(-)
MAGGSASTALSDPSPACVVIGVTGMHCPPESPRSCLALPPPFPMQRHRGGSFGHVRIVMPPLAGGKLGLVVRHLMVAAITDAKASRLGFFPGDRILAVNDAPVASSTDFFQEVSRAMVENQAGAPVIFDVWRRLGTSGEVSGAHESLSLAGQGSRPWPSPHGTRAPGAQGPEPGAPGSLALEGQGRGRAAPSPYGAPSAGRGRRRHACG